VVRNDRNILILGIIVLILLTVGYYFLLFGPLRQEYLDVYEQRAQKEDQRAELEREVAALENIRRNSADAERQVLEISKRIPEQDEIPTLLVQIEEIAEGANVTQLLIEPGDPEAPPGGGDFSRIPLTMSFEGTYAQMQEFLYRLRNLARLVTVNEVTFCRPPPRGPDANCAVEGAGRGGGTTVARSDDNLKLTVEIQAETYVQPAAGGSKTGGGGATSPAAAGKTGGGGKAGGGTAGGGKAR